MSLDVPGLKQKTSATIQLSRTSRGAAAFTVIESDAALPPEAWKLINRLPDTQRLVSF